jgi:hypothetical protein
VTAFPRPFPYWRFILVLLLRGRSLILGLLPHEVTRCAPPPLSRIPGGASPHRTAGQVTVPESAAPTFPLQHTHPCMPTIPALLWPGDSPSPDPFLDYCP